MSITVSHGADVNPYLFAVDRMVDTLIGIAVSLGVNAFHLPRRRDKEVLLVAEDAALLKDGALPSYCKVKLNQRWDGEQASLCPHPARLHLFCKQVQGWS